MKKEDFTKPAGELIEDPFGEYYYFIPEEIPINVRLQPETTFLLSEAERSIGMLSGAGELLPIPHLLINPYLTKEAVLSSKIEGTQASLSDVLKFKAEEIDEGKHIKKKETGDIREVANYITALEYGLDKIKTSDIDFSLIKKMHGILLHKVRGQDKEPGKFREMQNWIGRHGTPIEQARYVPPAPQALIKPLHDFVRYTKETKIPLLIQVALMHYHFEAVHPFRDGNGRIGRLLISLFLCKRKVLSQSLLYLSAYFEKNREEYYDKLLDVSKKSSYEDWIKFFLKGVKEQSDDALKRARKLVSLREQYHSKLREIGAVHNSSKVLDKLFENPFISISKIRKFLGVPFPTAKRAISVLIELGIVKEITGRRRNKIYCAKEILRILEV